MNSNNIVCENSRILNGAVPYTKNPLMEGFTENYFETKDHIKLRFLHKGEGMPLILIHGGIDDADTWMLNAPDFSEYYSVYSLELRGHGKSVASHGAHIHRLGADLHEFIEAIGSPKVNLCGWSMGCSVIWSYIEIFGQEKINKGLVLAGHVWTAGRLLILLQSPAIHGFRKVPPLQKRLKCVSTEV